MSGIVTDIPGFNLEMSARTRSPMEATPRDIAMGWATRNRESKKGKCHETS